MVTRNAFLKAQKQHVEAVASFKKRENALLRELEEMRSTQRQLEDTLIGEPLALTVTIAAGCVTMTVW